MADRAAPAAPAAGTAGAAGVAGTAGAEFERFYLDTRDRCFRALLVTVRDEDEADDLLAEAYARALGRWQSVRAHPAPAAWVVRAALNLHRDRWRRARRQLRLWNPPARTWEHDLDLDPGMLRLLWALPERQRQVVALRVLMDLDAEQTAAALGISSGTVGTHLHRALAALRLQIDPHTSSEEAPCAP